MRRAADGVKRAVIVARSRGILSAGGLSSGTGKAALTRC